MTWEVRMSQTRHQPYFYNTETKTSSWTNPSDLSDTQIAALPGAEMLRQVSPVSSAKPKPTGPVRASHVLVKYSGSQNPVSRNPANDTSVKITRSKSEAIDLLRTYEDQIRGSTDLRSEFEKIAQQHSDCASFRNKGDLDYFGHGVKAQMQKPFQDATYDLQVGEMSSIVETLSGMHLILRTA